MVLYQQEDSLIGILLSGYQMNSKCLHEPDFAGRTEPGPEADPPLQSWLAGTSPVAAIVAATIAVAAGTSKPTPGSPVAQERPEIRASAIAG